MTSSLKLMVAPLQGFTEAPFRHFHALIYGLDADSVTYFSPFVRIERGEPRPRDIRDIQSLLNGNHTLIPQAIARDGEEFRIISDRIASEGFTHIDLNMGCPFPPQVKKGRGSGLFAHPDKLREIRDIMISMPDVTFSVKCRLGINKSDEWTAVADMINGMPLSHVTIHPRTSIQQYSGALDLGEFELLASRLRHPVIFNGEINTLHDVEAVSTKFPFIAGVMIGRGLLRRPSLISEIIAGEEWSRPRRIEKILELHSCIFDYYKDNLSGDSQILSKIKPFWEYLGEEFEHKAMKRIKKANTIANYVDAVRSLN